MELLKSDIQRELEDLVTRLLRDKNAFSDLQGKLAQGQHFDRDLWASLSQLGLLCVPFSEQLGGTGGGFADVAVVVEALGKGLCIEPYIGNVVLCGSLLSEDSSALAAMMSGEKLLAFAHAERGRADNPAHVEARAEASGDGYVLSGAKAHVFGGDVADSYIVSARTSGDGERFAVSLFLVDRNAPGVNVETFITNDNMGGAEVALKEAPAQLIGCEGQALPVIGWAYDKATAAVCAEAVGAMEALVEATSEYVRTRRQFGTTIGSFQVVQHMAADMLVNLEHARSLSIAASRYADCSDELERMRVISAAKIGVNEAARFVAKTAVQLHGGIGMTEECAVGHYFRRLSAIRLSYGDTNYHLERMGMVEDDRIAC
ncbi:MAG: acyl-CoA dehydrogenase family protein [Pseudomonadales bacterium]